MERITFIKDHKFGMIQTHKKHLSSLAKLLEAIHIKNIQIMQANSPMLILLSLRFLTFTLLFPFK